MFLGLKDDKENLKSKIISIIFIALFFAFIFLFNKVEKVELTNKKGVSYEKAIVTDIIQDNLQEDGSRIGYQKIKVEMLSGDLKGKVLEGTSFAGYLYGADCEEGMKVIVSVSKSGENINISVYSYDRTFVIYGFIGFFLLMLWAIGGKKGFKSAIGLIFTFLCIIYIFLPMLYKGYSPFASAVFIIILINYFNNFNL